MQFIHLAIRDRRHSFHRREVSDAAVSDRCADFEDALRSYRQLAMRGPARGHERAGEREGEGEEADVLPYSHPLLYDRVLANYDGCS